jgi:hypothetical protein
VDQTPTRRRTHPGSPGRCGSPSSGTGPPQHPVEGHFNEIFKTHKPGLNVPFRVVCGDGRAGVTIDNLKNLGFVNIRDTSSGFTSFVKDNGLHEFLSSL